MFDILIKNGKVYDGSGAEGFVADVAVQNGKIAAVGTDLKDAKQVIDATGLAVTPGFIDSHSHSDAAALTFPEQIEKVEQGITTSIAGQCGTSPYPAWKEDGLHTMGEFLRRLEQTPLGANMAVFVGHNALRKAVMGMENRAPTLEELENMKLLLAEGMDAGAIGISFGLYYTPSGYAQLDELIALASTVAEKGGMIAAHIRNESSRLEEAVEEFISIVKASGVRGILSHHKAGYPRNHGKTKKTLKMLEDAVAQGCDIYCDVYPYIASRTNLASVFIPKEYRDGTLGQQLKDPQRRALLKEIGIRNYGTDLSWVLLNACQAYPEYNGLWLQEAAVQHGKDQWDTLLDILEKQPGCSGCYFTMCEEDVKRVISWPRSMIGTDASVAGKSLLYHPRMRGTFPRALGKYVREEKVVSLAEMIRKMTSLPASVYNLETKGLLRPGYDADLCIFDPETITDKATFTEPTLGAEGLHWVIVGGEIASENAVSTGIKKGCLLKNTCRQLPTPPSPMNICP